MYNDQIKAENKIITYDDLYEIFSRMQEKLTYYKKIYENEKIKNSVLDYSDRVWTFNDNNSRLRFEVDFYDNTYITFDNYYTFIPVFNSRLNDIKKIEVYFSLNYSVDIGTKHEFYFQSINMIINENKMDIQISLSSKDKKIDDIYELIKYKILNAKEKYDEIIKKKNKIITIIGLAIGFIPALILTTLLIISSTMRSIYANTYIVYPLATCIIAYILGITISDSMLSKYYSSIIPEQKYAGYDYKKGQNIYKDDIDSFKGTSEIQIGKNVNNLDYRNHIKNMKEKYQKFLPYEIGILFFFSIIVLFF